MYVLPVVVTLAALAVTARWPARLPIAATIAAIASLAITAQPDLSTAAKTIALACALVETIGLMVLIIAVVRTQKPLVAALVGILLGVAEAMVPGRLLPGMDLAGLLFMRGIWSIGAIGAAVAGAYLRSLDVRRAAELAGARRAQRLELARDLHDFVAHDVSGMVVQAQAAQTLGGGAETLAVLKRIEDAGLHALAAMDRTVHMLRDDDAPEQPRRYGVADLPDLVRRFANASGARTDLDLAAPDLPPELDVTAYRLVTEALTNVRRHAPASTQVAVSVRTDADRLEVIVDNDAAGVSSGRRSGLGLPGLTERVTALGGQLTAGPYGGGWRLRAEMPVR
jgi:signal transduction histidine kinase